MIYLARHMSVDAVFELNFYRCQAHEYRQQLRKHPHSSSRYFLVFENSSQQDIIYHTLTFIICLSSQLGVIEGWIVNSPFVSSKRIGIRSGLYPVTIEVESSAL